MRDGLAIANRWLFPEYYAMGAIASASTLTTIEFLNFNSLTPSQSSLG
ncbi:hypothetical protein [Nostoc sp.]